MVTYDDVLKDYNIVCQKREQLRKFAEMLNLLNSRPISEKYFITYNGYEITGISLETIEVDILCRINMNPFFHTLYRSIIYQIRQKNRSADTRVIGTKYFRDSKGRLDSNFNYVHREIAQYVEDCLSARIVIDGMAMDFPCRRYCDNIIVKAGLPSLRDIPGIISDVYKAAIDDNSRSPQNTSFIKNSTIIAVEGVPYRLKIKISNPEIIKELARLQIRFEECRKQ
jgi:hypothetical protein